MTDAGQARVPRFVRGARLRFDRVRQAWVILAPERLFLPDEQAVEVLRLVDGMRTFEAIVDDLCSRFAAPREVVTADVAAMLDDLAARGVLES